MLVLMAVAGMHVWRVHVGWLLQVMVVTADEELLKTLREANKLLEQVCGWQMHACRHASSCACLRVRARVRLHTPQIARHHVCMHSLAVCFCCLSHTCAHAHTRTHARTLAAITAT